MKYFLFITGFFLFACQSEMNQNPAAPGFNAEASDAQAIKIADQVMQAMGGRKNWDQTRYFCWNFFGNRHLVWDKQSGNVRIDAPRDSTVFLININSEDGRIEVGSKEITQSDTLHQYVEKGKSIWINDSYWLFMPFKLKDDGVNLHYVGEDTLPGGQPANVLELMFENVGRTPQNKYRVWVDQEDDLIKQWAFYAKNDQEEPTAVWPWDNYQTFGKILLSSERSDKRGPKYVQVFDTLPRAVFETFVVPDLVKF